MHPNPDLDVAWLGPLACLMLFGTLTREAGKGTGLANLMDLGAGCTPRQVGERVVVRALV